MLTVMNVAVQLIMIEFTPLTIVPLIAACAAFLLTHIPAIKRNNCAALTCAAIATAITAMLAVPVIHTMTLALTIGGLAVFIALAVVMCMALPALWRSN